jgi:GT2 family glycosyltransferase
MLGDKVGIQFANITGIKNPKFTMIGTCKLKKYDFEVIVDGNSKDFTLEKNKDDFILKLELDFKNKLIEVFLVDNNKKYSVCKRKNRLISRIKKRVVEMINIFNHKMRNLVIALKKGIVFLWRKHHFLVPPRYWKKYIRRFINIIKYGDNCYYNPFIVKEYNKWLLENEEKIDYQEFEYNPLISILIPTYNISGKLLSECLDSVLNNVYQNFEICVADDCSTNSETIDTLKKYQKQDKRIKVVFRKENGHISNATNSALAIASGEFIALMDNDDTITENALYEMVKVLNQDKNIDMIYSDEDKINLNGEFCEPNFKSDFAPDTLLSNNYICHFTLLRKSIVDELKGERVGFEGAQDYDLFLRFTEKTNHIYHIPKILYHWRMVKGSTSMDIDNKGYAIERGKKALEEALKRRNINGDVLIHPEVPYYMIKYKYNKEPKISIIIPTRDYADTLEECLNSVYEKTTYKNYEVLVMNNNSVEKETFDLFEKYKNNHKNFKVIDVNTEFNYSNINNIGVQHANGEYIVLLNNDTKIITEDWLKIMVGYAMQEHIGTVGVKLLYPDDTVQHGGIILGMGGVAGHAMLNLPKDNCGMYGRLSVPYNYAANTAACLMVSKKKFNEVNGLEEKLKVAFNDVDFNIKLLEKGYYNVFLPQVSLYHYESKSRGLDKTSEKYKRFASECEFMYNKWGNLLKNDPFYNKNYSLINYYMLDKKQ